MPDLQKVSVAWPGEQLAPLRTVVEAGEYAMTSDVLREAIRGRQIKRELCHENIERLYQLWDEGKASGTAQRFDLEHTLAAAQNRLEATGPT